MLFKASERLSLKNIVFNNDDTGQQAFQTELLIITSSILKKLMWCINFFSFIVKINADRFLFSVLIDSFFLLLIVSLKCISS